MSELGTIENPCTSKNSVTADRGMAYCKCDHCERIARCTPQFDFYLKDGTLWCNDCLLEDIRSSGAIPFGFEPKNDPS